MLEYMKSRMVFVQILHWPKRGDCKKRINEHKHCYVKSKDNSTWLNYATQENHAFDYYKVTILHVEQKGKNFNLL